MKKLTETELIAQLMAENNALTEQTTTNAANMDYISMMAGIDIPVAEEGTKATINE